MPACLSVLRSNEDFSPQQPAKPAYSLLPAQAARIDERGWCAMDLTTKLRSQPPCPSFRIFEDGIGGCIKARPEDFQVEEIPWRDPSGQGEYLYLFVEKNGMSHGELLAVVRKAFDCEARDVGYAGMKDKAAVTRQWLSIPKKFSENASHFNHEQVRLLGTIQADRPLRRGDLRGNRFVIKIRDIDPIKAIQAGRMLEKIEEDGLPAFYGPQRFGYRQNNHRLGGALLTNDWQGALDELLGPSDGNYPPHQTALREAWSSQDAEALRSGWRPSQRFEMLAARKWLKYHDAEKSIRSGGRVTLNFLTSAFSSFLFNQILEERCRRGLLQVHQEGDLSVDPLKKSTLAAEEGGIPSALFWGKDAQLADGIQGEIERQVLKTYDIQPEWLQNRWAPYGERRPMRFHISNAGVEGGFDEHGSYIELRFTLPRGMFATVVAAEIMGEQDHPETDEDQISPDAPSA